MGDVGGVGILEDAGPRPAAAGMTVVGLRPGMTREMISATLNPLVDSIRWCVICKEALRRRVRQVEKAWDEVRRTI